MKFLRLALVSSFALGCTFIPVLHADTTDRSNPALWVVSDDDTTITLFGTMHVMRPGVDWFHGKIRKAFDDSDEIVLESLSLDPAEQQSVIMDMAVNQSGRTLRSKLTDAERAHYDNTMQFLGFRNNAFDAFKPWMASLTLAIIPMMQAGYSPDLGVDTILENTAKTEKKPMFGLESFQEQLGFMDSMDEALQLAMLNSTVQEIHTIRNTVHELETLWSDGRSDELGRTIQAMMAGSGDEKEFIEAFNEKLLVERNRAWSTWIENRMGNPGKVFVAVGAAHLAGDNNLRDILESNGYTVTRVGAETASAE